MYLKNYSNSKTKFYICQVTFVILDNDIMLRFFKREEKRPFTYGAIVEHRQNSKSTKWIVGAIVLIIVSLIAYFIFK